MNLDISEQKKLVFIIIKEERLDAHNAADLKAELLALFEQGKRNILIDLQDVRFIDSSGLGALAAFGMALAAGPILAGPSRRHRLIGIAAVLFFLPLLFAADASLLSTLCHGTLLVVRIGHTTIDSVTRAMQSLCNNNVLGIVANGARASELYSKYTYYYSKTE